MIDLKRGRYVDRIAEEWLKNIKKFFTCPCRPYIIDDIKGRRYFSSYERKLRYQCLEAVNTFAKNKRHKKACILQLLSWWNNIDGIILAPPEVIETQVSIWLDRKIGSKALLLELSQILISYYEVISKKYGNTLVDSLNIKTCPYCNRQFIYSFKGRQVERPELDHFYPKAEFPLFCLSFYNLVPACHSCNHVKRDDRIGVNPYERAFRRKFILTDGNGTKLTRSQIYRLTHKEIRLRFDGVDGAEDRNVAVLGLNNAYNRHTDYVKELIDKSMAYDEHARKALVESFQSAGYHPRQVYDFVWGRHLADAEYEDRPLSKLTKDMLDLLDIHRR